MKYETLKSIFCLVAVICLVAVGQYIANQPTLTAFEKAIFPKALTEK